MGIKYLNSFLRENCSNSIKCMPVMELSGKKIAIDISIYLYKYEGDGTLIENMYLMMWGETGGLGGVSFFAFLFFLMRSGLAPATRVEEKSEVMRTLRFSLITILCCMLTYDALYWSAPHWLFFSLASV